MLHSSRSLLLSIAAIGFAPFLPAAEPALDRLVPGAEAFVFGINNVPAQRK